MEVTMYKVDYFIQRCYYHAWKYAKQNTFNLEKTYSVLNYCGNYAYIKDIASYDRYKNASMCFTYENLMPLKQLYIDFYESLDKDEKSKLDEVQNKYLKNDDFIYYHPDLYYLYTATMLFPEKFDSFVSPLIDEYYDTFKKSSTYGNFFDLMVRYRENEKDDKELVLKDLVPDITDNQIELLKIARII